MRRPPRRAGRVCRGWLRRGRGGSRRARGGRDCELRLGRSQAQRLLVSHRLVLVYPIPVEWLVRVVADGTSCATRSPKRGPRSTCSTTLSTSRRCRRSDLPGRDRVHPRRRSGGRSRTGPGTLSAGSVATGPPPARGRDTRRIHTPADLLGQLPSNMPEPLTTADIVAAIGRSSGSRCARSTASSHRAPCAAGSAGSAVAYGRRAPPDPDGCIVPNHGTGFGLLSAQLRPARRLDACLRRHRAPRCRGRAARFTSVWTTEYHSSTTGTALAPRRRRGARAGNVADRDRHRRYPRPLHRPLRLAEDATKFSCSATAGWSSASGRLTGVSSRGSVPTRAVAALPWTGPRDPAAGVDRRALHARWRGLRSLDARRPARPSSPIPCSCGSAGARIPRASRRADGMFAQPGRVSVEQAAGPRRVRVHRPRPSTFRFIHYSILLPGASRRMRSRATAERCGRCSGSTPTWRHWPPGLFRRRPRDRSIDRTRTCGAPGEVRRDPDELVEALLASEAVGAPLELVAGSYLPLLDTRRRST